MFNDKSGLTTTEARTIKAYYAKRWVDPINRMEDIFNVRRADGSLTKLAIPEPQKKMIRDGILGKSRQLVGSGVSYVGVANKGRQIGFSVIVAAESVLVAEDFPNTFIYYVATASDQASDWMEKLNQLVRDSNHWPKELGGGPILNAKNIEKVFEKNINGTYIVGLAANPSAIRGKTGIMVVFDEAAWAIRFKGQAKETWKALRYIIRQGGQARVQSTPRLSDIEEFFWGIYKKGEEGNLAIHTYYCPVIENWKDLDLKEPLYIDLNDARRELRGMKPLTDTEKQVLINKYKNMPSFEIKPDEYIKQKAKIPYWWISIEDLETDRASDLEQFKQENLGVPLDETYKLLHSEWIYTNLNEGDEIEDRGKSTNPFYILVDLAQVNDITAITVVEKIGDVYVERKIEETQASYPEQRDLLFDLYMKFRPHLISLDFTGHGRPVCEMLEEKLRNNGFNPGIVKRVTFTAPSKEDMAVGFRNIVMPDPITGKSRYRWLYQKRKHEDAIRHCMRVEKEVLMNSIRYSGKMHGRDDHFWSKAQIALIDKPSVIPKASIGRVKKVLDITTDMHKTKSMAKDFLDSMNKKRLVMNKEDVEMTEQVNRERYIKIRKSKNIKFAVQCLSKGVVKCRTQNKLVKPIHCAYPANCHDKFCPGYKYVEEIIQRYEVTKNEVWKSQREYPQE